MFLLVAIVCVTLCACESGKAQKLLDECKEGRIEIELEKIYEYKDGVMIKFLGGTLHESYEEPFLTLDIEVACPEKWDGGMKIPVIATQSHLVGENNKTALYAGVSVWGRTISGDVVLGSEHMEKGRTIQTSTVVFRFEKEKFDTYSQIITWIDIGETKYYIDLSDYLK